MSQVLAWCCDIDKKLFHSREEYVEHLKIHARKNIKEKKWQAFKQSQRNFVAKMHQEVRTVDQLCEYLRENWDWFVMNGVSHDGFVGEKEKFEVPKIHLLDIAINLNSFTRQISNTHSAPLNGVTNWHSATDKPRGYPGWNGAIKFSVSCPQNVRSHGSDFFDGTGINTGSGGGGSAVCQKFKNHTENRYRYDLKLFADDWVGLAAHESWNSLKK